jgi:hypothetical protein
MNRKDLRKLAEDPRFFPERLRRRTEARFSRARAFGRPGFDDATPAS